jgi:S1-C subfamily serine protease
MPPSALSLRHLSGPRSGETDRFEAPVAIGSDPASGILVPGAAACHAMIMEQRGDVVVHDAGSGLGTFLAGEAVHEAVLRDGDVLQLGNGGPRLRFQHNASEHGLLPRPLRATLAGLSLGQRLARLVHGPAAHPSRAFRVAIAVALTASALVLLWSQWQAVRLEREVKRLNEAMLAADSERRAFAARIDTERRRADRMRRNLQSRIEDYRKREEELNGELAAASSGEVRSLREELSLTRTRLVTLEGERAAGERIIREYGAGVCLIQGSYAFYDGDGKPLRYRVDENGQAVRDDDGNLTLGAAEKGPVYTVDYFGTGFLVDRHGRLLTNRHVAEPWWKDEMAQTLGEQGYTPRFVLFRAFFPREQEPFELETDSNAANVDLSLVRIELRGRKIPVLPLDRSGQGAVAGQPVVVVGYPTGLEAILAKADTGVVQTILGAHGTNSERVAEALGRQGLIRPSTTQGHIGDVTKTDIVFDASTTQGGSGGPVFNKSGQVVGVEYAVLTKFRGNSFGVPIAYALELLAAPKRKG